MLVMRSPTNPPLQLSATASLSPALRHKSSTTAARSASPSPYTYAETWPRSFSSASPTSFSARGRDIPFAVTRRSTPATPGRYANGSVPSSVPGSPRKFGPRRSAIADSAMPVVRSVPETTALSASPSKALTRGRTSSASMPRISRGTPGIIATQRRFSSSSQIPGAEPWRLVRIPAPSGISA